MSLIKYILGLLVLGGLAATIAANPGSCYAIRDHNIRAQCLAEDQRNYSYCFQIQDQDKKNTCLAVNTGNRSYCYKIRNPDERNFCLARNK